MEHVIVAAGEIWNAKTKKWDKFPEVLPGPFMAFGDGPIAVPKSAKNQQATTPGWVSAEPDKPFEVAFDLERTPEGRHYFSASGCPVRGATASQSSGSGGS